MEYESYVAELWAEGYRDQPSPEVAEEDAKMIEGMTCCWCSRPLRYEGFVHPDGFYIALAICHRCNYCEEF